MSSPGSQPGTGQPPQSVPYFYPMARPEDPVWLYVDKFGKQRGPVSLCELRYLIASSQVNSTTLGWREGMENWATLAHLPGVVDVFMEVSANEDGWFYIDDDEVKQGPLSPQLLQQMIISHQLIGSTRMWQPSQLGKLNHTFNHRLPLNDTPSVHFSFLLTLCLIPYHLFVFLDIIFLCSLETIK